MVRMWLVVRIAMCAFTMLGFLSGCGLKTSGIATRPPGHVKEDAGPDMPPIDAPSAADHPVFTGDVFSPSPIDCQGTEEQVNDCIINAPTKSGIPATRGNPPLTYQTCGAK